MLWNIINKESYYGMIDDTAKGLNIGINFSILNDRAIEEAVSARWHGKRFSERIWNNTDRLAVRAQELVTKSFMSGEAWSKTASKLADEFEVEKFRAQTLIHTEASHIHAMADLQAYKDMGAERYKYMATLDYITCSVCQPLDGMTFLVSEAQVGVNYPTMHPRCRCTTTIDIRYSARRARNPLTGKNELVDGNMTYSQWKESLTDEQRAALDMAKKKDSRRTADKAQYARYKSVLGLENVPETFDKWQDLKYNNSEKWAELKLSYKDKNLQSIIKNEYNLKVFEGRQGKHIIGHNNYIKGRSYLIISMNDAQLLINQYAGTGIIDRDIHGKWTNKEKISTNKKIGVILNSMGEETETTKFTIHYSKKKGAHIVPGARM